MIANKNRRVLLVGGCFLLVPMLSGCGPRMLISTGTTIGLKATPGDGQTRPPQVTFAYKRAETAFVPTKGQKSASCPSPDTGAVCGSDAFSSLAAIQFSTEWFGTTELKSFIGTGIAARDIIADNGDFNAALATAALGSKALATLRTDAVGDIADWITIDDCVDPGRLEQLFLCAGKNESTAKSLGKRYAGMSRLEFVQAFQRDYGPKAPTYRARCVPH